MLYSLYIRNFALIDTLDIKFEQGFSVITGETGAGKSIILGAINLLLGQRAESKFIKNKENKCIIEAIFHISNYPIQYIFKKFDLEYDPNECIIRRELYPSGKSRAFINDTPVSLSQIRELGDLLIDVHSQHQNLLLNKEDFQLEVVDILAYNQSLLNTYREEFKCYQDICKRLNESILAAEKAKEEEDYIRFQLNQLVEADLKADEQNELEKESEILSHSEDIKAELFRAEQLLGGDNENSIVITLKENLNNLNKIIGLFPPAEETIQRLESCYIELKDICQELNSLSDSVDFNPSTLQTINNRLNLIYELEHKHHVQSTQELIELQEEYEDKLSKINSYESTINELEEKKKAQLVNVQKIADELSNKRKVSAKFVEEDMKDKLIPLGMPNVNFKVNISTKELGKSGQDSINFLFSANKNGTLQKVSSVASGGEIARVMLSIKSMIAGAVKLPTIVFDEIDTGVSGEIADKMADIMQDMGKKERQVISITHLPQIAAKGKRHYKVYKTDNENSTTSHIRLLTSKERIEEVANMLSGSKITKEALNNALSLLNINN